MTYRSLRALGRAIVDGATKVWNWTTYAIEKAIDGITHAWNVVLPILSKLVDTTIDLTVRFIKASWQLTEPLRKAAVEATQFVLRTIKTIIWDGLIKTVIGDWICQKFLWNFLAEIVIAKVIWPPIRWVLENVIWKALLKTVIGEWICQKFLWNFLAETLIAKGIWPPIRWTAENIVWPIVKNTGVAIGWVVSQCLAIIAWTTKQALRLGR